MPDSTLNTTPFYLLDTAAAPVATADTTEETLLSLDSIFAATNQEPPTLHKSLFTHHALQPQNADPIPRITQPSNLWAFGIIILVIFFTYLFLTTKNLRIGELFKAAFNSRAMERTLRETNLTRLSSLAPIALLITPTIALILFYTTHQQNITLFLGIDVVQYLICFAALVVAFFLRNGLLRLFANALGDGGVIKRYIASNYLFHLIESIIITPLLLFVIFSPQVGHVIYIITILLVAILLITRILRGCMLILTNSDRFNLYLFYYLCTLEIAPTLIAYKEIISL